MKTSIAKSLIALTVGLSLSGCYATVEPGNVGVEVERSHVTGTLYGAGTHYVGSLTDIHEMSIRLQNMEEEDIPCRSHDNVSIKVDVTVSYTLTRSEAANVYKRLGDDFATVLLLPAVRSAVRDAVAEHEALTVAQGRSELETRTLSNIRASVQATLHSQGLAENAIRVNTAQLRNIELPETLTHSIESIQQQRNQGLEREQALHTAQQEAERLRIEAQGRNQVEILNAQREATVRQIRGESEALYNRTVAASLSQSLLEVRRIEAQRAISTNPNAQLVVLDLNDRPGSSSSPVILPQLPAPHAARPAN